MKALICSYEKAQKEIWKRFQELRKQLADTNAAEKSTELRARMELLYREYQELRQVLIELKTH